MQQYTLINGAPASSVSVYDRGLLYGQGLFETVRVVDGQPPLWHWHRARLIESAKRLGIDFDSDLLEAEFRQLLLAPGTQMPDATVRIAITGGEGPRGYRPPTSPNPTRIIQWSPRRFTPPSQVSVMLCETRLMPSAFAGLKHCNRLEQIAAAAELNDQVFEGLVADQQGFLIEATSANVICVVKDSLITPSLTQCGVSGVMRAWLLEQFSGLSIAEIKIDALEQVQSAALVNSNYGVLPIHSVNLGGRVVALKSDGRIEQMVQAANSLFAAKEHD